VELSRSEEFSGAGKDFTEFAGTHLADGKDQVAFGVLSEANEKLCQRG